MPPCCQHDSDVGESVGDGCSRVATSSVVGTARTVVAVEVCWNVGDEVGEGDGEAVKVASGTTVVGAASDGNEPVATLSGETCGLQAPSTIRMIRFRKTVHVRVNKSPLLLWLRSPV